MAKLSVYGTLTAPLLEEKRGRISFNDLRARIIKSLHDKYMSKGYLLADNIISRIVSKRESGQITIYKTTRIGNRRKVLYVVQRGEIFSHGETVKQAVHDLRYKLDGNRDTSEYKKWTLDTVKHVSELIQAYRVITGACETGTRQWCEGKKLPAKVSVKVAIRLTRKAYAGTKFAAFFKLLVQDKTSKETKK